MIKITEEIEIPTRATLQEWIEWAEQWDDEIEDRQYEIDLISVDTIRNAINHWRQDQGCLFDEDTDIARLLQILAIEKSKKQEINTIDTPGECVDPNNKNCRCEVCRKVEKTHPEEFEGEEWRIKCTCCSYNIPEDWGDKHEYDDSGEELCPGCGAPTLIHYDKNKNGDQQ